MYSANSRELLNAVAEGLHRAEVADLVVGTLPDPGSIPWHYPPLDCDATLLGVPLRDYLDTPVKVDPSLVEGFYRDALWHLSIDPSKVFARGQWLGMAKLCKGTPFSDRAHRFAPPFLDERGIPSPYAGQFFALDMAKLVLTSLPDSTLYQDEEAYVVSCPIKGRPVEFGVRDGLPVGDEQGRWDIRLDSAPTYVMMPRGQGEEDLMGGSVIERARTALYNKLSEGGAIHEFEGVDWGLQVLRLHNSPSAESLLLNQLVKSQSTVAAEQFTAKRNLAGWQVAKALVASPEMTDRTKILQMQLQLVPEVLSESAFRTKLYDLGKSRSPMFHPKVMERVKRFIEERIKYEQSRIK